MKPDDIARMDQTHASVQEALDVLVNATAKTNDQIGAVLYCTKMTFPPERHEQLTWYFATALHRLSRLATANGTGQ